MTGSPRLLLSRQAPFWAEACIALSAWPLAPAWNCLAAVHYVMSTLVHCCNCVLDFAFCLILHFTFCLTTDQATRNCLLGLQLSIMLCLRPPRSPGLEIWILDLPKQAHDHEIVLLATWNWPSCYVYPIVVTPSSLGRACNVHVNVCPGHLGEPAFVRLSFQETRRLFVKLRSTGLGKTSVEKISSLSGIARKKGSYPSLNLWSFFTK